MRSLAPHRPGWLGLALGVALAGCGARSGLSELDPTAARDAGPDTPLRDAGPTDAGPCVVAATEVVAPFDGDRAEGAYLAARRGGFDVASFLVDRGPAYGVRRLELEPGRVRLGARADLGPQAGSTGSLGVRAERLVLCYGDRDLEGPTRWVRSDSLDYAGARAFDLGTGGGDHCGPIVAGPDRWLVAWQDRRPGSFGWSVAEVDDDGRILAELSSGGFRQPYAMFVEGTTFRWLAPDPSAMGGVALIERDGAAPIAERSLDLGSAVGRDIVSPAPEGDVDGGREVVVVGVPGDGGIAWLDADWSLRGSVRLDGVTTFSGRAVVLRERRLAVFAECDFVGGVDRGGRIAVYDIAEVGRAVLLLSVPQDLCPARLGAAGTDPAMLAWVSAFESRAMALYCR